MNTNTIALDALKAAYSAMQHMGNVLNNIDAVDDEEDAQHDAAFEAVRAAIAELEHPKKLRVVAAPMNSYPEADQRFFDFWYGHMVEDFMQPPLVDIDHATARYIWNAAEQARAAIAAREAEPPDEADLRQLMGMNEAEIDAQLLASGITPDDAAKRADRALNGALATIRAERRAIEYGDIVHKQVVAMRAAVVAAKLESPEVGIQWIANTLFGPGHYPDIEAARELGGAQALFDKEAAELEAFRAAHPAPALPTPPKD